MRLRRRSAAIRVGLGAGLIDAKPQTGHGTVWRHVLAELAAMPAVKLVESGRADVWLAGADGEPPDGRPLVVQLHEVGWEPPALRRFLKPEFAEHLEAAVQATLEVASRVITPSEISRRQVLDAYSWPADRVHAVAHGVDHELFRPDVAGGRELAGAPYVLFVGVLHPRKNLDTLREAVAGLARSGLPHVLVVVANPPSDREEASELERRLELPGLDGRVRLLRHLDDSELAGLMAGADAFCLPSFFEGFGLPALEAMACGAPVVVSNRGALPEVVGDAGLVVEPEPDAVEHALRRVLAEPGLAQRLRAAGTRRAGQFDWRRTAGGWLDVLRAAA